MFRDYYYLTKPGIIYGNLVTTTAGFMLAGKGHISILGLLTILGGVTLVIASACVVNNYTDRKLDTKMTRTKQRALASGRISGANAAVFGLSLGFLGLLILGLFTNILTFLLGLIAYFVYVVLYGITKRRSVHGTLVGSIAGALPPVAGYTSVTNNLDAVALLLFLLLVFWQMPHFYAIAMYRFKDYKAAGLPVLPVKKGMEATKIQIVLYIVAFTVTGMFFTLSGYTHALFLIIILGLGLSWLHKGVQGFNTADDKVWARKMFIYSLVVNLGMSLLLSVGAILP